MSSHKMEEKLLMGELDVAFSRLPVMPPLQRDSVDTRATDVSYCNTTYYGVGGRL